MKPIPDPNLQFKIDLDRQYTAIANGYSRRPNIVLLQYRYQGSSTGGATRPASASAVSSLLLVVLQVTIVLKIANEYALVLRFLEM